MRTLLAHGRVTRINKGDQPSPLKIWVGSNKNPNAKQRKLSYKLLERKIQEITKLYRLLALPLAASQT